MFSADSEGMRIIRTFHEIHNNTREVERLIRELGSIREYSPAIVGTFNIIEERIEVLESATAVALGESIGWPRVKSFLSVVAIILQFSRKLRLKPHRLGV